MKKILIVIASFSITFCAFQEGMEKVGGSAGFTMNLEDDSQYLHLAPTYGKFISDKMLVEAGFTYLKIKECDTYNDWYYGETEQCNSESDVVLSFGAKYFYNDDIYFGAEYVPGIQLAISSPSGSFSSIQAVADLSEDDAEMMLWKLGRMSSIAENIYLDIALVYQTYMDSDIDHDGMINIFTGISYFWKD